MGGSKERGDSRSSHPKVSKVTPSNLELHSAENGDSGESRVQILGGPPFLTVGRGDPRASILIMTAFIIQWPLHHSEALRISVYI